LNGREDGRVLGWYSKITRAKLARVDEYEAAFHYERVTAMLVSGRQAWLYLHAPSASDRFHKRSAAL